MALPAWVDSLQYNLNLTKIRLVLQEFDIADVYAIRTALQLNTSLMDVRFNLGDVDSCLWWTPQQCAVECLAVGAKWKLDGWTLGFRNYRALIKPSLHDVNYLATALADPGVLPCLFRCLLLCF